MHFEAVTTRVHDAVNWARKFSLFQYPFVTACCGMEFMSVAGPQYDIARFGAEFPRFSPRQADLLMVVGTVVEKMAPVLHRIYEQMAEPKWVMAFGVCASSGGFYQNYSTTPGIDQVIPVDVYVPGCPPRPEQVLDGLLLLQDLIQRGAAPNQRLMVERGDGDLLHIDASRHRFLGASTRPRTRRSDEPGGGGGAARAPGGEPSGGACAVWR